MGVNWGNSLSIALFLNFILLAAGFSGAASDQLNHKAHLSCNGSIAECTGNDLEFEMESDISRRILADGLPSSITLNVAILQDNTIGSLCDRGGKYCTPDENKKVKLCSTFDRCRVGSKAGL
ncbi:hypothetical protein NMG60_11006324 [Bertholletia excelsa]